jgi:hypothetical protein
MAHVGKDNQLCTSNSGRKIVRVGASNEFFMVAIGDGNPRHFDRSELLRRVIGLLLLHRFKCLVKGAELIRVWVRCGRTPSPILLPLRRE